MTFNLGDRIVMTGLGDYPEHAGETGEITNDWIALSGRRVYAVTLDGQDEREPALVVVEGYQMLHEDQREENPCSTRSLTR